MTKVWNRMSITRKDGFFARVCGRLESAQLSLC